MWTVFHFNFIAVRLDVDSASLVRWLQVATSTMFNDHNYRRCYNQYRKQPIRVIETLCTTLLFESMFPVPFVF
jgi:hypothetical protein